MTNTENKPYNYLEIKKELIKTGQMKNHDGIVIDDDEKPKREPGIFDFQEIKRNLKIR